MPVVYWLILKTAAQVSEQLLCNGLMSFVRCGIRMLCGVSLAACFCMVCYGIDIFL